MKHSTTARLMAHDAPISRARVSSACGTLSERLAPLMVTSMPAALMLPGVDLKREIFIKPGVFSDQRYVHLGIPEVQLDGLAGRKNGETTLECASGEVQLWRE